jgi:tetratricopeptide (TPR) repeat protein
MTEVDAALTASYELLSEDLKTRWCQLSVMAGDFDVAGAAAAWAVENTDASELLSELVRHSLVEFTPLPASTASDRGDPSGRYHLHDLVRLYAGARLTGEARVATERRHAAHYLGVLRTSDELYLRGGQAVVAGLRLCDLEWSNIEAGHRWAAANAGTDQVAGKLCAAYPDAGIYCLSLRLHARDQLAWLNAAIAAARELRDRRGEGNALGNLGNAYLTLGDARGAMEYHEQALAISREIGRPPQRSHRPRQPRECLPHPR